MKKEIFASVVLIFCSLCLINSCGKISDTTLLSPDGNLSISFEILPHVEDSIRVSKLYYKVETRENGAKVLTLPYSQLGLELTQASFEKNLSLSRVSPIEIIDEHYSIPHGKFSDYHNYANERMYSFKNNSGQTLDIIARAYNHGVAFRYRVADLPDTLITIEKEFTTFQLSADATGFMMPYEEPGTYTPAYEAYYQTDLAVGAASPTAAGWAFPMLFQTNAKKHWLLITEALADGSYCGTHVDQNAKNGQYKIVFPEPGEGNGTGEVKPTTTVPFYSPWRVIMVGNNLEQIVESTLVQDINPPSADGNFDWVKPGRASWSWWSENNSPRNVNRLRQFIDFAQEMNWEYSLIDANWQNIPETEIEELVKYAEERGVGLFLWYNSGGAHNVVTEAPRDRLTTRERRRQEFEYLNRIGVKGVKVDFFQSDKQNMIRYYVNILEDAADFQLMVNFHGCTLPRGWSKTYPHFMTLEAVKGAECYKFDSNYTENAPWHNTVLAFTRNVVGPMDYTPLVLSNNYPDVRYPPKTTYTHELALLVIFESGLQHIAESPRGIKSLPASAVEFLKHVPAAWSRTEFIDGFPGEFVVIAREQDGVWYVGGINGAETPRTLNLDFSFLGQENYHLNVLKDGRRRTEIVAEQADVSADDSYELVLSEFGGFVMTLVGTASQDTTEMQSE